jgi:hypothetical protein
MNIPRVRKRQKKLSCTDLYLSIHIDRLRVFVQIPFSIPKRIFTNTSILQSTFSLQIDLSQHELSLAIHSHLLQFHLWTQLEASDEAIAVKENLASAG